jgi:diadenosine tetraphosphate (Ap4A) HIT family hydrolase
VTSNHQALLGYAMAIIPKIVKLLNMDQGYRVVINDGKNAGKIEL